MRFAAGIASSNPLAVFCRKIAELAGEAEWQVEAVE